MYNLEHVDKSGFGQSLCMSVSVCVSVCLAVPFSANFQGRKCYPIELKL